MEHVEQGRVSIHSVKSEDQLADTLTKPLPKQDYERLRDIIMGDTDVPSAPRQQGSVMDKVKDIPECVATNERVSDIGAVQST